MRLRKQLFRMVAGTADWLIGLSVPRLDRADVRSEVRELYEARVVTVGGGRALWWYVRQALGFAPRTLVWRFETWLRRWGAVVGQAARLLRGLRREPVYVLAYVLTLGVGIGGLAAVFAAANWVLLRPVPGVRDADRLVTLRLESKIEVKNGPGPVWQVSEPDRATLRASSPALTELAASTDLEVNAAPGGDRAAERLSGQLVTADYFSVLGMRPLAGRFFLPGEDAPGATDGVVVSAGLARRYWGGVQSAVGARFRLNGRSHVVVGVAPVGFRGAELPGRADVWLPFAALAEVRPELGPEAGADRGAVVWTNLIGRLAEGSTALSAQREANAAMEKVQREYRRDSFGATIFEFHAYAGIGLSPAVRSSVRHTLTMLGGAALFLLLLAVANAANLASARATRLRSAHALRRALGAGRWSVTGEVLLEHAVLGSGGGLVGLAVGLGAMSFFRHARLAAHGASLSGLRLDARVIGFTLAAGVVAGLLAALVPAWVASREPALSALRASRHGGARGMHAVRQGLVVLQVSLSVVLLVGALLLVRTVIALGRVELGFQPTNVLAFSVDPRLQGYDDTRLAAFARTLHDQLGREPWVGNVGLAFPPILQGSYMTAAVAAHPDAGSKVADNIIAAGFTVTPGILGALKLHLLAGRDFDPAEAWSPGAGDRVAIISATLARRLFPGVPPRLTVGRSVWAPRETAPIRIVGVTADARLVSVPDAAGPTLFRPWSQGYPPETVTGYVRWRGAAGDVPGRLRQLLGKLDPELALYDVATGREQVDRLLAEQRIVAHLATAMSGLGLVLAALGLGSMLVYVVAQRRQEIAIRSALGAAPGAIVSRVLARSMSLSLLGIAIGCAGAALLSRFLTSRLYGLTPLDPVSFGAGIGLMLLVALLATWAPALRAVRVPANEALREE